VGVVFGGVFVDGDRNMSQIGTPDLPGVKFFGSGVGHRAGFDVSSAGDFNQDGFGDLLITAPGEQSDDRWRGKPECPDGPRYKALGNSWAIPVVAWILQRVDMVDKIAGGEEP